MTSLLLSQGLSIIFMIYFCLCIYVQISKMGDPNGDVVVLDPRRNQGMEKKKLFGEMLLREIPGLK